MNRRKKPGVAKASLYPVDPEWWKVASHFSPDEVILASLDIDPPTVAVLREQARFDAIDPSDLFSGLEKPVDVLPLDFGVQQGEYERRLALLEHAIRSGTLASSATSGFVMVSKGDVGRWLLERGWELPDWLRAALPEGPAQATPIDLGKSAERERSPRQKLPTIAHSDDPNRMLRLKAVEELVGLSRSQIYSLIAQGKFPVQTKIGNSSLWQYGEIVEWIAAAQRAPT